jgi:hypothetical protein
MWELGAASGRGRPAHWRRGRHRGPGTAARASGAAPTRWPGGRSTAPPVRAARLYAVVGPLGVAEPVDGAPVPDRRIPVRATLGQPTEPAVQQAGDLDLIQRPLQPCQLDEFVLVAAARPAAVHPQQIAPYGAHRQPLGGVGVPFSVVQHPLVGPPVGPLHPGGQPVHADRLAAAGHLRKPAAKLVEAGDEGPVGLAEPESPSSSTAATASRRTSNESGGVPPVPGGRDGSRWARRAASQASASAGSDDRGPYDTGTRPPGRREKLAYGLVPVNVRPHRASRTPSMKP